MEAKLRCIEGPNARIALYVKKSVMPVLYKTPCILLKKSKFKNDTAKMNKLHNRSVPKKQAF
jgi:hypothetical protein